MKFDDNEISEYIAGVDNMLSSASQYLEDKHYQAKAAIDLLVEPGNETDMTTGLNAMYADMQSKIESLGKIFMQKSMLLLKTELLRWMSRMRLPIYRIRLRILPIKSARRRPKQVSKA